MSKKVEFKINGLFMASAVVGVFGLIALYKWERNKEALNALNVTSEENFIYSGLSEVVKNSTGGESKDVGGAWYHKCKLSNFEPWYCLKP